MSEMLKPSFIVTGASASGKTTLVERAIGDGYRHIPTHTTRKRRSGEVDGVHSVFLDKEQFKRNFQNGTYLEESLEFAYMPPIDTYYGSLASQTALLARERYCSSPVSIAIARKVVEACQTNWVHLVCDDNDRYERLKRRGISEEEIEKRMTFGDSIGIPDEAEILNTSELSVKSLYNHVSSQGRNKL